MNEMNEMNDIHKITLTEKLQNFNKFNYIYLVQVREEFKDLPNGERVSRLILVPVLDDQFVSITSMEEMDTYQVILTIDKLEQ